MNKLIPIIFCLVIILSNTFVAKAYFLFNQQGYLYIQTTNNEDGLPVTAPLLLTSGNFKVGDYIRLRVNDDNFVCVGNSSPIDKIFFTQAAIQGMYVDCIGTDTYMFEDFMLEIFENNLYITAKSKVSGIATINVGVAKLGRCSAKKEAVVVVSANEITTPPQIPVPEIPPETTPPQIPVPEIPPETMPPQIPVPEIPPETTPPQIPVPEIPPETTPPQIPVPEIPPETTSPQIPIPEIPPETTPPQIPVPEIPPETTPPQIPDHPNLPNPPELSFFNFELFIYSVSDNTGQDEDFYKYNVFEPLLYLKGKNINDNPNTGK